MLFPSRSSCNTTCEHTWSHPHNPKFTGFSNTYSLGTPAPHKMPQIFLAIPEHGACAIRNIRNGCAAAGRLPFSPSPSRSPYLLPWPPPRPPATEWSQPQGVLLACVGRRGRGDPSVYLVPLNPRDFSGKQLSLLFLTVRAFHGIHTRGWTGREIRALDSVGAKNPALPADCRGLTPLPRPGEARTVFPSVGALSSGGFSGPHAKSACGRCPPRRAVLPEAWRRFKPGPCFPSPETCRPGKGRHNQRLAGSPGKPSEPCSGGN